MTDTQQRVDAPTVGHDTGQVTVTYRNRHDAMVAACQHGMRSQWCRQMMTAIGQAWPDKETP